MKRKIAIIGGGASGIMAAISASLTNKNITVTILERMDRIGKKILATGNGRCNFTNRNTSMYNFYGEEPDFVKNALEEFTVGDTVDFFGKIGILVKEEKDGKMYPYSNQASSVIDALRNKLYLLENVEIVTGFDVCDIKKVKSGFEIYSTDKKMCAADRVIIAGGGCAAPNLGSNGSCFKLLKKLGHGITKLSPALVQIKTTTEIVKGLAGIKFDGTAECYIDGEFTAKEEGEILFTDYGLSGPPIFQLSAIIGREWGKDIKIILDIMPEYEQREIYEILRQRREILSELSCENFFVGMINKKIGNVIAKKSGIEKLSLMIKNIDESIMRRMAKNIKNLEFRVIETNGWKNAQVTAGGVDTGEFERESMESKKVKGLYCCGEIFDIYGDCGGYNLQWAWSSGYVAGKNAARI
ncbi:MAG: NAD(P)/FAD-dependent oxidoreductase [Firmicutes bacterium]|nr:NAD(P)/FAD-dependent oxidoreductase [Bacillota bacterium]